MVNTTFLKTALLPALMLAASGAVAQSTETTPTPEPPRPNLTVTSEVPAVTDVTISEVEEVFTIQTSTNADVPASEETNMTTMDVDDETIHLSSWTDVSSTPTSGVLSSILSSVSASVSPSASDVPDSAGTAVRGSLVAGVVGVLVGAVAMI